MKLQEFYRTVVGVDLSATARLLQFILAFPLSANLSPQDLKVRLRYLETLDVFLQNGLDINKPIEIPGSEDPKILLLEVALQNGDMDFVKWLNKRTAKLSMVKAKYVDNALDSIIQRRDSRSLDLYLDLFAAEQSRAQKLNQRLNSGFYFYSPTILNLAVSSVRIDANASATIEFIHNLIEHGVDPNITSAAGYTVAMEPSWFINLVRSGVVPLGPDVTRGEVIKAAEILDTYLNSPAFTSRAAREFSRKVGQRFHQTPTLSGGSDSCSQSLDP